MPSHGIFIGIRKHTDPKVHTIDVHHMPGLFANLKIKIGPARIWGLMFSHEDHAVVGGSTSFVDAFSARLVTPMKTA